MTLGRRRLRNIGAVSQLAALVEKGGQRGGEEEVEGDLVCFGTLLAEPTEVSSSIQLGDQCRSFPKRQKKKFPFPICEEEER